MQLTFSRTFSDVLPVMFLLVLLVGNLLQFPLVVLSYCTENCQLSSAYDKYPPRIRHLFLKSNYLRNFVEIFVIGDVHGCYDELQMLLQKSNTTSNDVLKIFVGDLLRKGPKSLEVINYVRNCSSCLCVRGNNEEKSLLKLYASQDSSSFSLKTRDKWMVNMSPADLEFLEELPYTISIPFLNSIIVHAGFLPGIALESQRPWTMMNLRDITPDEKCPGGFRPNAKKRKGLPWASQWKGPQHIYFGHDNKRKLQLYPFATGIDTSCFRGNYLTGIFISGPRVGAFVTQNAFEIYHH